MLIINSLSSIDKYSIAKFLLNFNFVEAKSEMKR